MYVVIGTTPVVDTSVVAGPYRSVERAGEVADEMTVKGWNAEIVRCAMRAEIEDVRDHNSRGVDYSPLCE